MLWDYAVIDYAMDILYLYTGGKGGAHSGQSEACLVNAPKIASK